MMQDGKALQAATSHNLGQNFLNPAGLNSKVVMEGTFRPYNIMGIIDPFYRWFDYDPWG